MDNLEWYWAYIPYLDRPDCQADTALRAGYAKVYFKDGVDAENRVAKRALWLTRAARAHAEWSHWATIWSHDYCCTIKRNAAIWRNMWSEVERKCLAKAEEYK